jgi:hypothetical protein
MGFNSAFKGLKMKAFMIYKTRFLFIQ